MKAQRRHELKENDLAHALHVTRRYLDENSKHVTIAVIILGAAVVAVMFAMRSRAAALEDVWRRRAQLSFEELGAGRESLESLVSMTSDVKDDRFLFTSLMEQGQQALRLAEKASPSPDRELNEKAGRAFEQLLARFPHNPLAKGVAHLGLATVEGNRFILNGDSAHKHAAAAHLAAIGDDPAMNSLPFKRIAADRRDALDWTFSRVEFEYRPPPAEITAQQVDVQVVPVESGLESAGQAFDSIDGLIDSQDEAVPGELEWPAGGTDTPQPVDASTDESNTGEPDSENAP